jgi:hypothetical protein
MILRFLAGLSLFIMFFPVNQADAECIYGSWFDSSGNYTCPPNCGDNPESLARQRLFSENWYPEILEAPIMLMSWEEIFYIRKNMRMLKQLLEAVSVITLMTLYCTAIFLSL